MSRSPRVDSDTDFDEAPTSQAPTSEVNPSSSKMKAAQNRAEKAEASLLLVLDTSDVATFVLREDEIVYANDALLRLLGYRRVEDFLHDQKASEVDASLRDGRIRQAAGEPIAVFESRTNLDFDGAPAILVRVRDRRDEIHAAIQQELAEASLRISEERYRVLFDKNPAPVYVFDPATLVILAANDAARRLYGYSGEDFLKLKLSDLRVVTEGSALVLDAAQVPAQLEVPASWRGTKTHRKKDGTTFQIDITAHGIVLEGRPAVLSMGRDVTEIERMERQLRQAQKMEAVGRLAGGIAHDFNNILAVILAVTDMMLSEVGDEHSLTSDLREIESAARRAADLTHQLLAFSRQQPGRPREILMNTVVSEMRMMISRTLREDISTTLVLAAEGFVLADPAHLEQVLLNLVVNARDAMADGGQLVIRTDDVDISESDARPLGISPGPFVRLSVTDTGTGIDPVTAARIFDPFFTTKEVGKGSGLGLASVFGIVKQADGAVSVHSTVGQGSTFHVLLPRIAAPAGTKTAQQQKVDLRGGSEKVLVVEDDENVRIVVSRLLRTHGYTVIEAGNGHAALDLLAREPGIAIVLSDLVMPQMDGRTLSREIAARSPATKVIFMSGHEPSESTATPAPAGEDVLAKPFTLDQILHAVRRGIDSNGKTR